MISRKKLQNMTIALACVWALIATAQWAQAETIAVLGTGRVGSALGPQFSKLGFTVRYGSRDPARPQLRQLIERSGAGAAAMSDMQAVRGADYVLIALPWSAAQQALKSLDLAGKIVIDATNALRVGPDKTMEMAVDTSTAEHLQALAPKARLVKAFNAVDARVMADPAAAGGPVTIFLAGDDADAKQRVGQWIGKMGFETFDAGPLRHARVLEGMALIKMYAIMSGHRDQTFEFYLRPEVAPKASSGLRPAE